MSLNSENSYINLKPVFISQVETRHPLKMHSCEFVKNEELLKFLQAKFLNFTVCP